MLSTTSLTTPFKSLPTAYHPHWEEEAFIFQAQALRASSRHVQNKDQGAQAQDWEVAEGAEDEAVESREDRIVEVIRDNGEAYLSLCVYQKTCLREYHCSSSTRPTAFGHTSSAQAFHHHFAMSNYILPTFMSAPATLVHSRVQSMLARPLPHFPCTLLSQSSPITFSRLQTLEPPPI